MVNIDQVETVHQGQEVTSLTAAARASARRQVDANVTGGRLHI